jgi:hypothetical protein
MLFDKATGKWIEETFSACVLPIGKTILIGHGHGPWSVKKVKIVEHISIGPGRVRIIAEEIN